ncbi:pyridoxamine 5'-phosphate oxidase family protein [Halomonas binhaiensis]|uniref:Pyridoxamine 5'-phosphate oxidase family protein n=1 Tax=Halomonas binhaiensis TaxID=2562282 RepID=A0A856QTK7_9GAMM|nr:pyridoxamine 5'-phosphate oxidase family protein [Halomonas binhaiensis]QEM83231.2 pyridoxamine 5'-phosphate oxidase family protein [Halomonas binhaiensis]
MSDESVMSDQNSMPDLKVTGRTKIKRGANRASFDRKAAYALIDHSVVCHLAHLVEGHVVVTPTCHWREGDHLYWHGHRLARNVVSPGQGRGNTEVSINICALDGLVLARSAFHHSVNYRSLTLFGIPEEITNDEQKALHLERFVDKLYPGRWAQLRPMTRQELAATGVSRIPINEASLKVRSGMPVDDEADLDWPAWAGVVPRESIWGKALPDSHVTKEQERPVLGEGLF